LGMAVPATLGGWNRRSSVGRLLTPDSLGAREPVFSLAWEPCRHPGLLLRARPSDSSASKVPRATIVRRAEVSERWKRWWNVRRALDVHKEQVTACVRVPARLRLERPSGTGAPPRGELIASGRSLDQPPDQPAPAQRKRWEHVLAAVAADVRRGRGPVVRVSLRETPDSHPHRTTLAYSPSVGASW